MKKIGVSFIMALCVNYLYGQLVSAQYPKPPLDSGTLDKWPTLERPHLSPDGQYASYAFEAPNFSGSTLFVQKADNSWKREYNGVWDCNFSKDGKTAFFQRADSLYFIRLGTDFSFSVKVKSWKMGRNFNGKWIAYESDAEPGKLVVFNLVIGKKRMFNNVIDFVFDQGGNRLLLKKDAQLNSPLTLSYVDVASGDETVIWSEKTSDKFLLRNYIFDDSGSRCAFQVENKFDDHSSIYCYALGAPSPIKVADDRALYPGYKISGPVRFSLNAHWILFQLQKVVKDTVKPRERGGIVDIWGYRDLVLQPEQLLHINDPSRKINAVASTTGNIVRILDSASNESVNLSGFTGDYVIKTKSVDRYYMPDTLGALRHERFYLEFLKDGSERRLLAGRGHLVFDDFYFSPDGRYVFFFDPNSGDYFCYDVTRGISRDLTHGLPTSIDKDFPGGVFPQPVDRIAGWLRTDNAVLIYDNYDIWELDPEQKRPPVNLTQSYGFKHHIKLRIVESLTFPRGELSDGDSVLLTAFNVENKYNGYFRLYLDRGQRLVLLTMGPYTYYRAESQKPHGFKFDDGWPPVKAFDNECWLLKRETASEAPNLYFTRDFKTFIKLTDFEPQRKFNWITTQLITWRQFDGKLSQGILYKPEDFDPHKKYPIIFNYYQKMSHRLYEFPYPAWTTDNINIPWFVSHGYLVFTPDIHYSIASKSGMVVGACAYNSVVSAALYLSGMPYVDGKRMALQGHSFGACETNYIVTHSGLFRAAVEAAGETDVISSYLTLIPATGAIEYGTKTNNMEVGDERYGATLWQRPDLYLQGSAVLHADKVSTPLLIMHNELDNNIAYRQGIEFYMALRRLGKKVWLLQYDKGGHTVNGAEAKDYTIRVMQFFDYYLKGDLPPIWMTKGVPAKLRDVETGYRLDNSGDVP